MNKVVTAVLALMMTASLGFANGPGRGPGGPGDFGRGPEGGVIVASNGSVFVISNTYDSSTSTSTTTIRAIGSSGSVLWTQTLTNARGRLVLSGSNLITVNETEASDGTVTSTLTAISTATGTTAWTKTINGRVMELEPFNGGTYAVVVIRATTSGGSATRSLVAISDAGATLWTLAL